MFIFVIVSCSSSSDDDNTTKVSALTVNLTGLEDLGNDFLYEGWIIVNGKPVSTGTFSVNATGVLSKTSFNVDSGMLASATKFVVSIEPKPDPSPDPAKTKLLIGDFVNKTATLGTGSVATSFSTIEGKYIIASPTGTEAPNEMYSGIWFLDNSSGSPKAGLKLPTLEAGWKYEGWVVIEGKALSTGTFTDVSSADEVSVYGGAKPGAPFPGEDYLTNAPDGLKFPTDLRGMKAVISVEPFPDNNPAPFTLKPLAGKIPVDAKGVQQIENNVSGSFPKGTVNRS